MNTILNSLSSVMTSEVMGKVGKATGTDPSISGRGLAAIGPLVLGSLAKTAGTSNGASSLLKMLPKDTGGSLIGNLIGGLTGSAGSQEGLVNSLLGPGVTAMAGTLTQKLGFDVRSLLGFATPLVAGLLSKTVKERNLDATGLSTLLRSESDAFMQNPANKEVAGLVSTALAAGDKAAAIRRSFNDAEWEKIRMAPLAAVYLVATASPPGLVGELKELSAAAEGVSQAVKAASPTSLIATAFSGGLNRAELELLTQDAPPRERILGSLRDGLALVAQKSPADAPVFRNIVLDAAQKAAEASKEGGFLGMGGTRVSNEEQQALNEIAAALAMSAKA
jgi:Bacterial protein of unknown function (DUF937)